jgi:hypothetical protein
LFYLLRGALMIVLSLVCCIIKSTFGGIYPPCLKVSTLFFLIRYQGFS